MDNLDKKIRAFLVEEGYLFPVTDQEIEQALKELERSEIKIPLHLDNPAIYLRPFDHLPKRLRHKRL